MTTLVVGAGFSGATIARALHDEGEHVIVIDRRAHIGGTAYDYLDEFGVRRSSHGAHLFHTNAPHIAEWLGRFASWRKHEHRVLADVHGMLVPVPINRDTINDLFEAGLRTSQEAEDWLRLHAEPLERAENGEDQVVRQVGRELFDLIYRDYTLKQWGRPARELSSYVTGRIPVRTNVDSRYFADDFQAQPSRGWTAVFEEMLAPIDVCLNVDYRALDWMKARVVYTGGIDEFFDYRLGRLPWRSVRFEHQSFPGDLRLPVGVINYCGREPFTRRIEWGHFNQDTARGWTTISTEFPEAEGEPHYPVPCPESWELRAKYMQLAAVEAPHVTFTGRLGSYRYMTMDQTIGQALKVAGRLAHQAAQC